MHESAYYWRRNRLFGWRIKAISFVQYLRIEMGRIIQVDWVYQLDSRYATKGVIMSIAWNKNLVVAKNVLILVNKYMSKELQKDCTVEAYSNGREQGYSIICWSSENVVKMLRVCFSEYRNSDDIVVYCGKHSDFSMAGNVPNDEVYANKKFFKISKLDKVKQAHDAAMFIISFFSDPISKAQDEVKFDKKVNTFDETQEELEKLIEKQKESNSVIIVAQQSEEQDKAQLYNDFFNIPNIQVFSHFTQKVNKTLGDMEDIISNQKVAPQTLDYLKDNPPDTMDDIKDSALRQQYVDFLLGHNQSEELINEETKTT